MAEARAHGRGDHTALLALLFLGLVWSAGLPLAKLAAQNAIPVLGYMAWVTLGGFTLLGIACRARGLAIPLDRASLRYYAMAGLIGHAIPQINIFIAASHAPVSTISIVITSVPIMTYAFALIGKLERFNPLRALGLLMGILGALFILVPDAALPDPSVAPWVAFAFLTPFCYALSNVLVARFKPDGAHPMTSAWGMLGAACLLLWPSALIAGQFYLPDPAALNPGDMALGGQTLLVGIGYILFFFIIHRAGPVYFTMVSFVVLALATVWGVAFFAESLSLWFAAAVACVVAGVTLIQRTGAVHRGKPG